MRKLDWDDVRIFLAVARKGSLRAAGRDLGLSQPTVGRRLAGFEAALGAEPLFDRLPEGLRLTASGAQLVPIAERLEAGALALRRGAAAPLELAGNVRVSVGEWAGGFLAPRLAGAGGPPRLVTVELVESDQIANLTRRAADLAVRHGVPEAGDLYVSRIGTIACAAYGSRASPAAPGTWVTYTEEQAHYAVSRWMAQHVQTVGGKVAVRASRMAMQVAAARAGAGLVVLPCYLGDADRGFVRVTAPLAGLDTAHWLIVHRDLRRMPRVRAVMDWVRDTFAAQKPILEGLG